ncbi:MAG: hypothetical protein IJA70_08095, partial [Oscillospiraceae bacterium]|nr:hypothetical protein [Oscillospiraceae bacterium]
MAKPKVLTDEVFSAEISGTSPFGGVLFYLHKTKNRQKICRFFIFSLNQTTVISAQSRIRRITF